MSPRRARPLPKHYCQSAGGPKLGLFPPLPPGGQSAPCAAEHASGTRSCRGHPCYPGSHTSVRTAPW
eukprot:12601283-Alexandrium_andersonii.AAC.1